MASPGLLVSPYVEEEKDADNQEKIFDVVDLESSGTEVGPPISSTETEKSLISSLYVSQYVDYCKTLLEWCAYGAVVIAFFIFLSVIIRVFFFQ